MGNMFAESVLIAGLGNPGPEYDRTRHNAGFMALDEFAKVLPKKNFEEIHGCTSHYLKGTYAGSPLFLQKPETFMNLSGDAIVPLMKKEGISPKGLIVIYDDMDLELGKIRIREKGSCGGHNGMRSIIGNLGSESFARIRIGIGHHTGPSGADYVLSRFTEEEEKILAKVLEAVSSALVLTMRRGIRQAMNEFNALDLSVPEQDANNS